MHLILIALLCIALIYVFIKWQKERFIEKSFLSIVNHTFRTPLTRIKWMSDSLKEDLPRKESLEVAGNLSNSVDRLLEIVDIIAGIKDIHNPSSYNLKAVSIREIIEESLKRYHALLTGKNISLRVPSFVDAPLMSIDTKKISFVINVILENAILYGKQGGAIEITSRSDHQNFVIQISDDGLGLTGKEKSNLFSRFYRGSEAKKINTDGMGLGLYAAREIVRRHSGTLSASSRGRGQGTAFSLTLPIRG